ncbi:(4Fe-4S)-binding protein [Pedobacter sp. V48]
MSRRYLIYDPSAVPWIPPENATPQEPISQVASCPSGALTIKLMMPKTK